MDNNAELNRLKDAVVKAAINWDIWRHDPATSDEYLYKLNRELTEAINSLQAFECKLKEPPMFSETGLYYWDDDVYFDFRPVTTLGLEHHPVVEALRSQLDKSRELLDLRRSLMEAYEKQVKLLESEIVELKKGHNNG